MTTEEIPIYTLTEGTQLICECDDGSAYATFLGMDGMYGKFKSEKGNHVIMGGKGRKEK
jgi:hypothetical protein